MALSNSKKILPLGVSLVLIYYNLGARNAQQNLTKIQLITTDIPSFVTPAHPEFNHKHYCNQAVNHILKYFIFWHNYSRIPTARLEHGYGKIDIVLQNVIWQKKIDASVQKLKKHWAANAFTLQICLIR